MRRGSFELPQGPLGRIAMAVVCLPSLPASASVIYLLLFKAGPPQTILGWALHLIADTFFVGLLMFSAFGLVWAVARPGWAERLLQASVGKITVALFVLGLLGLPLVVWALLNA